MPLVAASAIATALVCVTAAPAAAQIPIRNDRWFVDIGAGLRLAPRTFEETVTPTIYDERGTVTTSHKVNDRLVKVDVAGGVRVAGDFGVGAAYSRFDAADAAQITARVPHPVLFNQPRLVTAVPEGLQHSESALHVMGFWSVALTDRIDVLLFAGPSFVTVSQDLVSGIAVAPEAPPYAAVTIASTSVERASVTAVGFNAGADFTYFVTPAVGVGATLRLTNATADFTRHDGGASQMGVGGAQVAFGARLRFP